MAPKKGTKKALAKKLGISRSALYYRPKKPPADLEEKQKIEAIMSENPAYGHRRIAIAHDVREQVLRTREQCVLFGGQRESHIEIAGQVWRDTTAFGRSSMRRRMSIDKFRGRHARSLLDR